MPPCHCGGILLDDLIRICQRGEGLMFNLSSSTMSRVWLVVSLCLVLSLLLACGGAPEPEVVVVTARCISICAPL